jgi:flagellar biosynthesis/type III secretory pathway protein FliH
MPLIKNTPGEAGQRSAVVLDLADLSRSAERLVDEARRRADAVIRAAQEEARRVVEAARAEARVQGREEGRREGAAAARTEVVQELSPRIESMVAAWSAALEQYRVAEETMRDAAARDVVEFALEVARKVVLRTIAQDPGLVRDQVVEALRGLARRRAVEVRIHPADRAFVEEIVPRLASAVEGCEHVQLVEDEAVQRGGCLVRGGAGQVDARVATQLDAIARAILPPETAAAETSGSDGP